MDPGPSPGRAHQQREQRAHRERARRGTSAASVAGRDLALRVEAHDAPIGTGDGHVACDLRDDARLAVETVFAVLPDSVLSMVPVRSIRTIKAVGPVRTRRTVADDQRLRADLFGIQHPVAIDVEARDNRHAAVLTAVCGGRAEERVSAVGTIAPVFAIVAVDSVADMRRHR